MAGGGPGLRVGWSVASEANPTSYADSRQTRMNDVLQTLFDQGDADTVDLLRIA